MQGSVCLHVLTGALELKLDLRAHSYAVAVGGPAEVMPLLAGASQLTTLLLTGSKWTSFSHRLILPQLTLVSVDLGHCNGLETLEVASPVLQTFQAPGCGDLTVIPLLGPA